MGDRLIQIGDWRLGWAGTNEHGSHFSISHKDGQTAQVFRSDGTLHHGPRTDYSTWHQSIDTPSGISMGDRFIQIEDWRLGWGGTNQHGSHFSISHKDGQTAQVFKSDGTLHDGPRTDYSTWQRAITCSLDVDTWQRAITMGA